MQPIISYDTWTNATNHKKQYMRSEIRRTEKNTNILLLHTIAQI